MTDKMIAYCGVVCNDCPAYIATQANDEKMAKKTAEEWSKAYNADIKVDDVWCDGCLVERATLFLYRCIGRRWRAGKGT